MWDNLQMLSKSQNLRSDIQSFLDTLELTLYGKTAVCKLLLVSLICNDHILLEDVPGTGKTMLAKRMAEMLDLDFKRVQGTPDLLPSDLTGVNVYNQKDQNFNFTEGPIFTNILLFDEINRTSPKTQSALLEAMEEHQVTIDKKTYKLEEPFFVIATQNPIEHLGTYPLPQAQLDRFLIKTMVGYPSKSDELAILKQQDILLKTEVVKAGKDVLNLWQREYKKVFIKDSMLEKLLNIIVKTRNSSEFVLGISPRAGHKFIKALKVNAYIHNRDFVTKDDIFDLFLPVMTHRVFAANAGAEKNLLERFLHEETF